MSKNVLVIVGPTAVGKTDLCVRLAKYFNSEIFSFDSRQFYQEMSIGTAKPTKKEMDCVPHYFINNRSIFYPYTVASYAKDFQDKVETYFLSKRLPILTGGSGLYLSSVINGLHEDIPPSDLKVREELEKLYKKYGIQILRDKLFQLDDVFIKRVDINNPKRLIRAIEICIISGKKYSSIIDVNKSQKNENYHFIQIGLDRDREELYRRINLRVDNMISSGLVDEAEKLHLHKGISALKTVGYKEIFEFFEGKYSLETAIDKIKNNTREYARKQLTWFRQDKSINWFHPDDFMKIVDFVEKHL